MAKPTARQMRLPALIASAVFGLALAPLPAMAATVISVGDGDTLRVEDAGKKVTIRLACIDAPEMAQSPFGQQARQALQELLPVGSTVTLRPQTKDRYGRTVAEVFTQSGANAGLSLVQQGHAFAYRQYMKQCDQWAYLDREKLAERYRLGVWRATGGIERPWDFRAVRRGGRVSLVLAATCLLKVLQVLEELVLGYCRPGSAPIEVRQAGLGHLGDQFPRATT